MASLREIRNFLDAGACAYRSAKRVILEDVKKKDDDASRYIESHLRLAESIGDEVVDRTEREEEERRQSIEAKARTNLIAISLAVAIATALFGLRLPELVTSDGIGSWVVRGGYVFLWFGWLYLVMGGFFAFRVLEVRKTYVVTPQDHKNHGAKELRALRLFNLDQNQSLARIMSNGLAVSFAAIRNGIVVFAFGITLLVLKLLF